MPDADTSARSPDGGKLPTNTRTPAIRRAAADYRRICAWTRLGPIQARMLATDKADARAFLLALVKGSAVWTDASGRTFALAGPSRGCQLAGPTAEPGVWFGGAGF